MGMTQNASEPWFPDRYQRAVVPHVLVDDAPAAIAFYEKAFDAKPLSRLDARGGGVLHAEISIAGSTLMIGDTGPSHVTATGWSSPAALGGTTTTLHVWVPDVDAVAARASVAGAEVVAPPEDQFHGDRTAILRDPFGHLWVFLTHIENMTADEVRRRFASVS